MKTKKEVIVDCMPKGYMEKTSIYFSNSPSKYSSITDRNNQQEEEYENNTYRYYDIGE